MEIKLTRNSLRIYPEQYGNTERLDKAVFEEVLGLKNPGDTVVCKKVGKGGDALVYGYIEITKS